MKNGYKENRTWSDIFIRQLKQIAGLYTISVGNPIQDMEEGTDLITLSAVPKRIACRVRRPEYYPRYRYDITIRAIVKSGAPTEFQKLMTEEDDTWQHIYIYCFSNTANKIVGYHVIDIPELRSWAYDLIAQGTLPDNTPNNDGTWFKAFDTRRMPIKCIIHSTEITS